MFDSLSIVWVHGFSGFVVYVCSFVVLWCVLLRFSGIKFDHGVGSMTILEWVRLVACIIICVLLSVKAMLWLL